MSDFSVIFTENVVNTDYVFYSDLQRQHSN
jgi:hypothetical protein